MGRARRNQRRHGKKQRRMYLSTSFKTDHELIVDMSTPSTYLCASFRANIMIDLFYSGLLCVVLGASRSDLFEASAENCVYSY